MWKPSTKFTLQLVGLTTTYISKFVKYSFCGEKRKSFKYKTASFKLFDQNEWTIEIINLISNTELVETYHIVMHMKNWRQNIFWNLILGYLLDNVRRASVFNMNVALHIRRVNMNEQDRLQSIFENTHSLKTNYRYYGWIFNNSLIKKSKRNIFSEIWIQTFTLTGAGIVLRWFWVVLRRAADFRSIRPSKIRHPSTSRISKETKSTLSTESPITFTVSFGFSFLLENSKSWVVFLK